MTSIDTSLFPDDTLPAASSGSAVSAPYRVLARKYRPVRFDQLIGQEGMVRSITNAIANNRLPQAWMLTGVRGIGKTTTARIIARALTCVGADGKGGATITPCGVCGNCTAIMEDRHVDVQELDAASRTGVDDIREIIDGVRYSPVAARYKIYILDEVHMLSKNAFNALLKTLEEPPPHAKFIFATTEIRKVPVTVLSRCQRFDLRRIEVSQLVEHFKRVCAAEGANAEDEALTLIARAADGSVRDGLSLLDQAISRGDGNVATAETAEMLGIADRDRSLDLTGYFLSGNAYQALAALDGMLAAGADALQIAQDIALRLHQLTRAKAAPDAVATLSEAERNFITTFSALGVPALTRAWQIMLKGLGEVQSAPWPGQALEMVIIRLCYAARLPTPAELVRKAQNSNPDTAAKSPTDGAISAARAAAGGRTPVGTPVGGTAASGVTSGLAKASTADTAGVNLPQSQDQPSGDISSPPPATSSAAVSSTQGADAVKISTTTLAERKAKAMQNPLLQKVLATFPNAEITDVAVIEQTEPTATPKEADLEENYPPE